MMAKMASMMVFVTMMLFAGTAKAQMRCLDPDMGSTSEQCSNGECRITGQSRRRLGRVGATMCLGGQYKRIFYQTTTTEAQCNATPAASSIIASTLPADYTWWSTDMTDAENFAAKSGACYSPRRRRGSQDNTVRGYMYTCSGVADTNPPVKMVYEVLQRPLTCTAASWTRNDTTWQHQINERRAPCFCHHTNEVVSECTSCDKDAEYQCSTQSLCDAAADSKCSWSGNACTCASGNYRKTSVCMGGALHDLYFQDSSYSACKAATPAAGTYKMFPTNSRRRGGATSCQSQSSSWWNGSEHIQYDSMKEFDCTGVADFGNPVKKFFTGTGCATSNMVHSEEQSRTPWDDCSCMSPEEEVRSECSSCGGSECGNMDACTMSQQGMCAWNSAAAAGSQCSCSTGIFKSDNHCWGGLPAEIIYEGTDSLTKCTAESTDATFHRKKEVSDDSSWTQCRQNWDMSEMGTHMKERVCTGVADGKAAVTAYYNDASCSSLNHTKANTDTSSSCSCEIYNGCAVGTKFEKYVCASDTSITAVEYTDGLCTTATGVTRTLPSLTDALNLGVCGAWPPIALKPKFEISVLLKCPAAHVTEGGPVTVEAYQRMNKNTMTPSCMPVAPQTAADIQAQNITECFCKDQFFFKQIAAEMNVQVSGDITLTVSDVAAATSDVTFKKIVKSTIAESAGVSPNNIINLQITAARRLNAAASATPRMLASGSVKAEYLIVIPKVQEATVKNSIAAKSAADMTSTISAKISNSPSVTFTATVTATSAPQAAPATVAFSSTGTIVEQGVDASGAAITTTAPPGSGTASTAQRFATLAMAPLLFLSFSIVHCGKFIV